MNTALVAILKGYRAAAEENRKVRLRELAALQRRLFREQERLSQVISQTLGDPAGDGMFTLDVAHLRSGAGTSWEPLEEIEASRLEEEIRGLMQGGFEWDEEAKHLHRKTEPITLVDENGDDRYLGPFDLRFVVEDGRPPRLYAVATDPHPAESNPAITHPHVKHDHICFGDGYRAFTKAMEEGRLGDAVEIAESVLFNYADDSPYCVLEEWERKECPNCGEPVEDLEHCEGCGTEGCPGCLRVLDGNLYCDDCVSGCDDCGVPCIREEMQDWNDELYLCHPCWLRRNEEKKQREAEAAASDPQGDLT